MSIRARATLVTAIFLALLTLTLIGLWLGLQGRYLYNEQYRRARVVTRLVEEVSQQPLEEGHILRLAEVADKTAADKTISRVLISDRTGAVMADSKHSDYLNTPLLMKRALTTQGIIIEPKAGSWWGAMAVRNDLGQVLGGVMIEFPAADLESAQRRSRIMGLLLALAGIGAGSGLAFFAAQVITRPLQRLLEAIRRLQRGEAAEPVPASGGPELAEIGAAFNEMSGEVRERLRRLELLNQMAADLPPASDFQAIALTIRQFARSIMEAKSYIWVMDQLSRTLSSVPAEDGEAVGEPVAVSPDIAAGRASIERRTLIIGGVEADLPAGSEIVPGLSADSAMVLPLITQEGIAGVLALAFPESGRWMTQDDRVIARAIGNAAGPVIMARLRAETQSRTAAALQSLLVPTEMPSTGVDVGAVYAPAEEMAGLGGDYYDLVPLGEDRWCIIVGDTSGKGLEAAQHTATVKYVIRSYVLEYGDSAEALSWSNRALVLQERAGMFITVFCGILNTGSGDLSYANAGHTAPILYSRATGKVEYGTAEGMVLGVMQGATYTDVSTRLESGDILCVYTDGITEARRGEEWFGESGLSEVIVANADRTADEICQAVLGKVRNFRGEGLKDDVVLVVLKMP